MKAARLLVLAALGFCLSGCAGLSWPDQPQAVAEPLPWLMRGHTLGQTFTALEGGLAGIEIFVVPDPSQPPAPGAEIELRLRSGPREADVLAQARTSLSSITQPGFVRFTFPPLPASLRQDYFVELQLVGEGRVQVGQGPGAAYWSGALYADGEPVDAQLAFRLVYAPAGVAWGVFTGALWFAGWLILGLLLVAVPGGALLAWAWPASAVLSWGERLGLAVAVGAALYPLLFLWTDLLGLHLGPANAWLPLLGGAVALGLWAWRRRAELRAAWGRAGRRAWWSAHGWAELALVIVMGAVFFSRWWAARALDLPLWGDSVQHTMIVQLLLDHGGLFDRWAPYAELISFSYHFGFHALVAAFHWVSGAPAALATLWFGQILNGLAVLALYPLGVQMSGNRWGGVLAVLVAGLVAPHPAYYPNWGRYTQLAGQFLLPAAVYFTWAVVERRERRWGLVALGLLVTAGLALTHYRVLAMYACFVVALAVLHVRQARRWAGWLLILGVGSVLVALPWILHTLAGPMLAFVSPIVTTPAASMPTGTIEYNSLPDLRGYPTLFWLLAGLGLVSGLWQRRLPTLLVAGWWVALVLLANPAWLGLPGTGLVNNFAIFIAAYIGGSLLAAASAAWLARPRLARFWPALMTLSLVAGGWGWRQRVSAIEPERFALVSRPDLRAATWIDANLPAEARLLVNTFFAYSGSVAVGGDAGWWLPLLAQRNVTLPPINYATEAGPRPDYQAYVEGLPAAIRAHGLNDAAVQALLREYGVTHVYIGQQHEQAGGGEPFVLRLEDLLASPHFQPVYHEDRVWVFAVLP